jgi:MYXO-CTERM domain-containing protein
MRRAVVVAVLLLFAAPASAADSWSDPHPGIRRLHRVTASQNINALVVDLCAAGISARATAHGERGKRVSTFATSIGAQAAVNGDFFSTGFSTDGLAMSGGALWPGEADHSYVGPIAFGDRKVGLVPHEVVAGAEPWMREIVSGHPTLLVGGVPRDNSGDTGLCTARHPRTAVGLSADKTKLYMVVVDGRATARIGMTCAELGDLMKELGAHDALNLDGGGSSAMFVGGAIVNNPSDGSERTVANHLAIYAKGSGDAPNCPIPRFAAQYVGDSGFPGGTTMTLPVGGTAKGCFEFKNIGTETWMPGKTLLGTTKDRDRMSAARAPDWISENRAGTVDKEVKRGENGKFCFSVKAPASPSTITEYFGLVEEGVMWFADSGGPADDVLWLKITATEGAVVDAGVDDAAFAETGALPDEDTGVTSTPEADPSDLTGGCGCHASPRTTSWALLALLLPLLRRRRSKSN